MGEISLLAYAQKGNKATKKPDARAQARALYLLHVIRSLPVVFQIHSAASIFVSRFRIERSAFPFQVKLLQKFIWFAVDVMRDQSFDHFVCFGSPIRLDVAADQTVVQQAADRFTHNFIFPFKCFFEGLWKTKKK